MRIYLGIVLSFAAVAPGQPQAAQAPAAALPSTDSRVSQGGAGKTILLWTVGAPGAQGDEDIDKPTLTVFLPVAPNAAKTGVVVAPGGGYQHLAMEKEGYAFAGWLNERGVAAFVLKYRLGPKYHHPIELGDAQRAIRMVRAHAAEYGVAEDHVGMWGSSAGGHLAATAGTHFDAGNPDAADPVERKGSRPDFLILSYPVITLEEPWAHGGSGEFLLGENPDPAIVENLSNETQVTKETPPTFLFATTDDKTVPVLNSVMFYESLVKAEVPAEMHLFQHGAHGAGLAAANPQLSGWPDLLIKWMRERGYASPAP
ncbi:alpha/beta hydrolase [Edaphobacter bradus]|uniref:alpha/beta hydrolase n=1 Tax=Edaphobacter bradus TaxID=2259016 RepID=UPI0021DF5BD9|nr:alpha/beta hydrolase [Edaphobacter bradus]